MDKSKLNKEIQLSPEVYDHNKQYEEIIRKIDSKSLEEMLSFFKKIIKEGKVMTTVSGRLGTSRNSIYLSKEVINHLKNLLNI